MAGGGKHGAGERILESRHLVGLFLGVVLLCGVFFSLGYVMGKTQYNYSPVHAAETPERNMPAVRTASKGSDPAPPVPPNSEWDFYSKNPSTGLDPAAKPSAAAPKPAAAPGDRPGLTPARFEPPRLVKGSIVLQVAALTHESDALAIADALQQKQFPSFVVAPSSDNFYRVQVGPYADERAAESARNALERAGFKAIIKR